MLDESPDLAFFINSLGGGGAERVILKLADRFSRNNYDVDIVLIQRTGEFVDEIPSDVRSVDLNTEPGPQSLPALIKYLRSEQPAAMLSTITENNLIAIWAKIITRVDTRLVIREANDLTMRRLREYNSVRERLIPVLVRIFYRFANKCVCVSHGLKESMISEFGVPPEKVTRIHNPSYDPNITQKAKMPVDCSWFEINPEPVVLGVGRLVPQKGFDVLIRAFAILRKDIEARLIILGNGQLREELINLADRLGVSDYVCLPGFVENPYAYMSNSDVFALSSLWEGLPNVLIEAMACKTPVVATDCRHGPAEILDDGKYGQLVPVEDPNALARALLAELTNPTDTSKLRQRAEHFNIDRIWKEYEQVLFPDRI